MRVGAFDLEEPLPQLHEAHALAMLQPWVDVGSVGSSTLTELENHLHARPLGKLRRPGHFFDFTRYRPTARFHEGQRVVTIPNVAINYAHREQGNDLLFLHLMEPHMLGEAYVSSIVKVLERFNVQRYCLLGAMYDMVPHTRPLQVTGSASSPDAQEFIARFGVSSSSYEGPTTILTLLNQEATLRGWETMGMIAHLPQYAPLEQDASGQLRLLEVLGELYHLSFDLSTVRAQAEVQRQEISAEVERNPQLRRLLHRLEARYEAQLQEREESRPTVQLPPQIEQFLRDMDTQL